MKQVVWFLMAAILLLHGSACAGNIGWKIDEALKVQMVYLPSEEPNPPPASASAEYMEPLLENVPAYRPDIDNISYRDITGLGFPLPDRKDASSLKLYLKLYLFPMQLDSVLSSYRIFNDFLLFMVPGGERLYEYAKNRANVFVKRASIDAAGRAYSKTQPFAPPLVPKQWEFDSHLPFSSIYVTPENALREGTEPERARASAQGVMAFHAALGRAYEAALYPLAATHEKRYFAGFMRCPSSDMSCGVRIYEVPVEPMVFSNYRDLPMPQDENKVFLSGLLLVKLTEYAASSPMPLKQIEQLQPGTPSFAAGFRRVSSHMLEVGSVLDLR